MYCVGAQTLPYYGTQLAIKVPHLWRGLFSQICRHHSSQNIQGRHAQRKMLTAFRKAVDLLRHFALETLPLSRVRVSEDLSLQDIGAHIKHSRASRTQGQH